MGQLQKSEQPVDLVPLIEGIVADAQQLLAQQFELATHEMRHEAHQAVTIAARAGGGAGLVAAGGLLGAHMIVHALHRYTRLPLWGAYGLVGGILGAAGAEMLRNAGNDVGKVRLVPPQTAEALKENMTWLKEQMTPLRM
ncbi:MAG: phage holin family protein [Gemmataceae bacterium]